MLSKQTLSSGLQRALQTQYSTAAAAATSLSNAYYIYAQAATAGAAVPIFTGTEVGRLRALLLKAMIQPSAGRAVTMAGAWADGILSFWMMPPVPFAGAGQAGAVTGVASIPAIRSGLLPILSNVRNTSNSAATQIAQVLDTATRGILVTLTPPPGTVVPLV